MWDVLVAKGLIGPKARLTHNVTISTGDGLSLELLDRETGRWYFVKATKYGDLSHEFANQQAAHVLLGSLVPKPLACEMREGWSILVAAGVQYVPTRAGELAARWFRRGVADDLMRLFALSSNEGRTVACRGSHCQLIAEMLKYFRAAESAAQPWVVGYLEEVAPTVVGALPHVPQHGDLTVNNLGKVRGRLVVFDWEDYGAVSLAGFDVCVLSMSVAGWTLEAARRLSSEADPAHTPWRFAPQACATLGLPYDAFRNAVPAYLVAFRYLKRNYGLEIQQKMDQLVAGLLGPA